MEHNPHLRKRQGFEGAGLQLFRAITSCPSFISNVARVSPFEKKNQRQVQQGTEGAEVKADLEGQEAKQTCKFGVRGGLCGLQNFEGGF